MAVAYKILGQQNPGTTLTKICGNGTPSSGTLVVSTLVICNRSSSAKQFRVASRPNADAIADKHYLAYDSSVPANDTIIMTLGITLGTTEIIEVYGSDTTVSFSAFGSVIT